MCPNFYVFRCHVVDKEEGVGSIPANSELDFHDLY